MAYKLATAFVDIVARAKNVSPVLNNVKSQLMGLAKGGAGLSGALGVGLGLGSMVAAGRQFVGMAEQAIEVEQRLRSVLRATGEAAGFNAKEVLGMVDSLKKTSVFSGGELQGAATNLLKFDKVSGDTFKEAMKLSTDLAAIGFGSVESAAQALGRALQDPARGVRALRSAGIVLNQEQTKMIAKMVEAGQIGKAQALILDLVRSKAEGAAEAFAKTPAGQWKQIKNQLSDVGEELGKRLIPTAIALGKALLWIGQKAIEAFDFVTEWAAVIYTQWPTVKDYLLAGFDFLGSSIIDILMSALTLPFRNAMNFWKTWFEGIPKMLEAAATGNLETIAATWEKEFIDHYARLLKEVGNIEWSEDTKNAKKEMDKSAKILLDAKKRLEATRAQRWGLPDMAPLPQDAKKQDDAKKKLEGQLELPSGLTGLTQAWSTLQEAMLKKDDPQKEMAEGIKNVEGINEDMLNELTMLNKDGLKLKDVAVA